MKVVVRGNDAVSPHLIENVSVTNTAGVVEVLVKHRTEKSDKEKTSVLADPRKSLTPEVGQQLQKEITQLMEDFKGADVETGEEEVAPDFEPNIEEVIKLTSWSHGHLAVNFEEGSEARAIALAELCWWWPQSQKPSDKQLALRMSVEEAQIVKIAGEEAYRTRVKEILGSSRTPEDFVAWAKAFNGNYAPFGTRMRLDTDVCKGVFEEVAKTHGVDIKKKEKKVAKTDDAKESDYDVVWGEYSEPDTTKFAVFGRTTVTAPTLNRAKTLATQEMNEWLKSEIDEKDDTKREALVKAQEAMLNAVSLHKGKWEEGRGRAKRFFGQHMNIWCGIFLGVSIAKKK